jgi:hypothetical protein
MVPVTQSWFPLEVGNRWDYTIATYSHGGTVTYDTSSIEIIDQVIINNKTYYRFSIPFYFMGDTLIVENDSLFIYNSMDSSDCLAIAFNLNDSTGYSSCLFDTAFVASYNVQNIFGYSDSVQLQFIEWHNFEFSKKLGPICLERYHYLFSTSYCLAGCIISGVTYGNLLVGVNIKSNASLSFVLYQNYPNPFNPSTKIKYSIPKVGTRDRVSVQLKVFNILGNEIATVVNEEKPAGEYEVEFNAVSHSGNVRNLPAGRQGLSSGIYFYQLKVYPANGGAGDPSTSSEQSFVETKKMVLLR